jgi:hypothetical protein
MIRRSQTRITDLHGENSYLQEERGQSRKEKNQIALRIAQSKVMKAKVPETPENTRPERERKEESAIESSEEF